MVTGENFKVKRDIGTLRVGVNYSIVGFGKDFFKGKRMDSLLLYDGDKKFNVPTDTLNKLETKGIIKKL